MTTVKLRNATAEATIAQLGLSIAQFHKDEAKRILSESGLKQPVSTFYWRGLRGTPRKVSSVDAVPPRALARPPATIAFTGRGGTNIAVEVAITAAQMFRQKAPFRPGSGRYAGSLALQLNGKTKTLSTLVLISQRNPLLPKERVSLFPATEYASTLESVYYRRAEGGILYAIARSLIGEYGSKASIRFYYVPSDQLGLIFKKPYAVPLIEIGGAGEFANTLRKPGVRHRKRQRDARRAARSKT